MVVTGFSFRERVGKNSHLRATKGKAITPTHCKTTVEMIGTSNENAIWTVS